MSSVSCELGRRPVDFACFVYTKKISKHGIKNPPGGEGEASSNFSNNFSKSMVDEGQEAGALLEAGGG